MAAKVDRAQPLVIEEFSNFRPTIPKYLIRIQFERELELT